MLKPKKTKVAVSVKKTEPKKPLIKVIKSKATVQKPKAPTVKVDVSKPKLITSKTKSTARSIRTTLRQNPDGTHSSHLMESGEGEGKYKYQVNPTIFPNADGTWKDLGNSPDRNAAYNEAKKRGEVFGFKREKKAEKFAYGSWKEGKDRRQAMKEYRADKKKK